MEKFKITRSGITVRADPASTPRASIRGRVEVTDAANDVRLDYVRFDVTNHDLGLEVGNWDGGRGTAYTVTGEIVADPLYVNRGAKDFRLQAGSPCAGKGVQ